MYEAVHAYPDGESTVARHALTASEYGFDGLVVRNHGGSPASYDPEVVAKTYDIDVVPAVEIRATDPSEASGYLGSHREQTTLVVVHGGTPKMNRFAVEQSAVDVLAHPMAGDGDFNHVLANEAVDNDVSIEFNLRGVLRDAGGTRVQTLSDLQKLREIVDYYDVPYVVSADPTTHLQLRAPQELEAVGSAVGLSSDDVRAGLTEWGRLVDRNRARQSDSFVQPGVRRVDTETSQLDE
ncbi:RNase P subunit p30 family protein [Halovenus rubra]|uniref:RNase P subunit p30 family protein n=2 Tax=Halovenus rubra TaxID=869890 RepID=A0ACC7DWY0_9EURY|nr:RNase P subunit p30 family protein [Halovenus rubra]